MTSLLFSILLAGILPFADSVANRVWLGSSVSAGEYRNVFDAAVQMENRLGAQGADTKGPTLLFGRFEYGYDYGKGVAWRGWTDPYSTPFMVCDSIPGDISRESYDMQAAVAWRTGRWKAGADLGYRTSLMAKHKDLRNKNTRMDFSIAPGITYDGNRFHFAATAGYVRNTEQVEYMQVDESTEKYLFQTYGLWFYTGSGFSSAENKRFLSGHGTFADVRVSYERGEFNITHGLTVRYGVSTQTETGYNNLHHGDTRTLEYKDVLSVRAGRHFFSINGSLQQMAGLRTLQRQELDPASKIRRWFSYGEPSDIYWREVLSLGGSYSYIADGWSVSGGAGYLDITQSYKEYPAVYAQTLSFLESWLAFAKDIQLSSSYGLEIGPSLGYKHKLSGNPLACTVSGGMTVEDTDRQLKAPMDAEFAYWSSDTFKAGLSLNAWHALRNGRRLTVSTGLSFAQGANHASRSTASISIRYNF